METCELVSNSGSKGVRLALYTRVNSAHLLVLYNVSCNLYVLYSGTGNNWGFPLATGSVLR